MMCLRSSVFSAFCICELCLSGMSFFGVTTMSAPCTSYVSVAVTCVPAVYGKSRLEFVSVKLVRLWD
ncbi:hypothetical protein M758_1G015700 [Ceratodon purpureus]|nr:hypothetical protein M758_1G015700 [Ceratodon purpureus]